MQTLQDYNDAIANAASELEKGTRCSQQTVIVSDANGTVVEVADSEDPVREPNLVHVTSEGQFEIQGTLTSMTFHYFSGARLRLLPKYTLIKLGQEEG